jgi:hypothetical protein
VTARGKIAVLTSGVWLYGSVNRGQFAKAIAPDSNRTFTLTKQGWRGDRYRVTVRGSSVDAFEWQVTPPKRKRPAKRPEVVTPAEISDEDRRALAEHMAGVRNGR